MNEGKGKLIKKQIKTTSNIGSSSTGTRQIELQEKQEKEGPQGQEELTVWSSAYHKKGEGCT